MSCNGVPQCWPVQRGQAIVPGSSPYMVHGKWIQAHTCDMNAETECTVHTAEATTTLKKHAENSQTTEHERKAPV